MGNDIFDLRDMDAAVPGGVYLCQAGEQISCGACCGLYNVADVSRETLTEMLRYRTETFATVPRDVDAILAFRAAIEARENQERPFPEFHHCPYIGLIGDNMSRVGCLLHPLADGNGGVDFRGLSFYGGMACRIYFCPTCREVPQVYKEIVRAVSDDWYSHGLIVTEARMITAFFEESERRAGRPLQQADITEVPMRVKAVREFLNLKSDWPFRPATSPAPSNYFFEDRLYPRPPVRYPTANQPPSRYDILFRELESVFESPDELRRAENLMDRLFDRLA
ncbi:hypothetical protein DENIS_0784 [Desulfonema ishimotonii]|uniref:Uncharacterized protein n=1 Tax=Desulfonema ishimotonii TaxID=45657 RepID=A0A401FSB3_9BACT|nr:hypothetical protein [Desulfonema ishimotonii]GBC59843.1 hypothetical protein DENIS_0784 [Desulfonema ishimotonii]